MDKVFKFIDENRMLEGMERVVVGLSGGADSVCLLLILLEYIEKFRFGQIKLTAVHIQHGIRGEEALRDAVFCEELCKSIGVEFRRYDFDVPSVAAQRHMSCEEAGRALRYEAFAKVAAEYEHSVIAVAHHANDQAETVLHNIVRGSFLKGGRGMLPVNGRIIRPLLTVTREAIEHYLKEKGQEYCTDSTNLEEEYCRNRLRLKVIPYLEQNVNRESVDNICKFASRISTVDDYISMQADKAWDLYVSNDGDISEKKGYFIADKLCEEHDVIQSEVIYRCLASLGGRRDLEEIHVQSVISLFKLQCGKRMDLPFEIMAERTYGGITIRKKADSVKLQEILPIYKIEHNSIEDMGISSMAQFLNNKKNVTESCTKLFDYGKITKYISQNQLSTDIELRHRKSGDYLVIDRQGHRKKIKELLIEAKIPSKDRDSLWLFAVGNQVLWIVGVRDSQGFLLDETTQEILSLHLETDSK